MEQHTGPIIPPVHAAGTDPAHIPGIPPPRSAEEEAPPEQAAEHPPGEAAPGERAGEESGGTPEQPPGEVSGEEEAGACGPAFEASDRRGSITADRSGITFRLDGEEAEFPWDEIGAVEIGTPRFGRRFAVTVCTTDRRWYEADVEAPARGLPGRWAAELDAVLDVYFEGAGS